MCLTVGFNNILQPWHLFFRSYYNNYTPKISVGYWFIINARIVNTLKYIVYSSGIPCGDFHVF